MIHVRYYVEWVSGDVWHDAPTRYASKFSYLNKQEAANYAESLKKDGFKGVQLVEFMQDLPVPVEVIWNHRLAGVFNLDQWNWS